MFAPATLDGSRGGEKIIFEPIFLYLHGEKFLHAAHITLWKWVRLPSLALELAARDCVARYEHQTREPSTPKARCNVYYRELHARHVHAYRITYKIDSIFEKTLCGSLKVVSKYLLFVLTKSMYYIIDTSRYHIDILNLRYIEPSIICLPGC